MVSFRDKDHLETCLTEDNRAFVFDWVAAPLQQTDLLTGRDIDACIEDILDDLQEDISRKPFTIRIRP